MNVTYASCIAPVYLSSILDDWSGVDKERACSYIIGCLSYDGGLALTPEGSEGQGGNTYCGIASLP